MNKQTLILCIAAFVFGCGDYPKPLPFNPRVEVSIIESSDSIVVEVCYLYSRGCLVTTKINSKEQLDLYIKDIDLLQKKLQEVQSKMEVGVEVGPDHLFEKP